MPKDVAIVLSGGGTYLYAHIGILEALEDAGLLNDRANGYQQHQQVQAVAGTSAGSLVGSFLAVGYPPHEIWKLAHWRVWGGNPPDDPQQVHSNPVKPDLSGLLDFDWQGVEIGLTKNLNRFKGFIRGQNIIQQIARYQYIQRDARSLFPESEYDRSPHVLPAHLRKELYIVASNLNDARETIFHFAEHLEAPQRDVAASATRLDPALGREVNYAVYRDYLAAGQPAERIMTIPEAIRCSFSIPTVFRPYYKILPFSRAGTSRLVGAYYSDGSARDDFPISVAAKIANCKRIFGVYLGYPEYPFRPVGQAPITTLFLRIVNTLLMQTIYEADQDDAEIMQLPVRVAIPTFRGSDLVSDAVLDFRVAIAARRAGYIAGAYCLYLTRWALDGVQPNPRSFVEGLLDRARSQRPVPLVTWDELFSEDLERKLGEPAQGRTGVGVYSTSLASNRSHYYTLMPMGSAAGEEFYATASAIFDERYGAQTNVAGADYNEGDQIDLDYAALEQPPPDDALQKRFDRFREVTRLIISLVLVSIIFTVLILGLSLVYGFLGKYVTLAEVLVVLLLASLSGWLLHSYIIRQLWQQLKELIRRQLAV